MKEHICSIPNVNSQHRDGYIATCLGFIKGKVLKVEETPDKFEKTGHPCIKIRINKAFKEIGGGIEEQKPYLVYYGLQNPWGEKERPEVGETYWFYLHEWKNDTKNFSQRGWQWTHDWQLVENHENK